MATDAVDCGAVRPTRASFVMLTPVIALAIAFAGAIGAAAALAARDVSGVYSTRDGSVAILQDDDELWLAYQASWGATAHTCACLSRAKRQSDGSWQMTGDLTGTITMPHGKLQIDAADMPPCCGANWNKVGPIKQKPSPVMSCSVTADKLPFQDRDGNTTKAFVISGDHVDAVEAPGDDQRVVARFVGKRKATFGLVAISGLACK